MIKKGKEFQIDFVHVNNRQYGELNGIIAFLRESNVRKSVIREIVKLRDAALTSPSEFVRPNSCPECGNSLQFK